MDELLNGGWVDKSLQEAVSFAAYWKDPFLYEDYVKYNIFLADINNERPAKNQTYKYVPSSLSLSLSLSLLSLSLFSLFSLYHLFTNPSHRRRIRL